VKRITILLSMLIITLAGARAANAQDFMVIVNEANPSPGISSSELARVFQKQATRWSNVLTTEPVDLAEGTVLRDRFTRQVFARTTAQIKAWWQSQMFAGRFLPQAEVATENQVVEFVQRNGGAIGYVSLGTRLPEGVKRLPVGR